MQSVWSGHTQIVTPALERAGVGGCWLIRKGGWHVWGRCWLPLLLVTRGAAKHSTVCRTGPHPAENCLIKT